MLALASKPGIGIRRLPLEIVKSCDLAPISNFYLEMIVALAWLAVK